MQINPFAAASSFRWPDPQKAEVVRMQKKTPWVWCDGMGAVAKC